MNGTTATTRSRSLPARASPGLGAGRDGCGRPVRAPLDTLAVNGLGGDDRIAAEPAVAQLIAVLIDGGDGTNIAVAQGSEANDALQIFPVAPAVGFAATGANGFVQALSEQLLVDALGGDDSITAANGLAPLTQLTIDGGPGNDSCWAGTATTCCGAATATTSSTATAARTWR